MEYGRVKNEIKEDHLLRSIVNDSAKPVPGMMSADKIGID